MYMFWLLPYRVLNVYLVRINTCCSLRQRLHLSNKTWVTVIAQHMRSILSKHCRAFHRKPQYDSCIHGWQMSHTAVYGETLYSVLIGSIAYVEQTRSLMSCSKDVIYVAVNSTNLFALDIRLGLYKEVNKTCRLLQQGFLVFSLIYTRGWPTLISLRGVVG